MGDYIKMLRVWLSILDKQPKKEIVQTRTKEQRNLHGIRVRTMFEPRAFSDVINRASGLPTPFFAYNYQFTYPHPSKSLSLVLPTSCQHSATHASQS